MREQVGALSSQATSSRPAVMSANQAMLWRMAASRRVRFHLTVRSLGPPFPARRL
jgi:hypothetical protein